jgi:hypothetical protein
VIEANNGSTRDVNLFYFAAFADKQIWTLYNNLTVTFPFISLEENVCFLFVYLYESNAILALPILGFSNNVIFAAYKQQYKLLKSKGFVIKSNVMDNQASNVIKQNLIPKQCDLMLVESNNHQVNAAECAIQTFKNHFVRVLATTDSKFPLQLWDHLAPHVETLLNMLRPLCIDPRWECTLRVFYCGRTLILLRAASRLGESTGLWVDTPSWQRLSQPVSEYTHTVSL